MRHKPMADFAFYRDVYIGDLIPEKAFSGMTLQAKAYLQRLQRIYRVTAPGEESLKMAVCAVAEALYAHSKRRGGVTAATVGQVSVRYEGSDRADSLLQRELYERASIYLEISRGVEV